jgi:hypothetical protein
MSSDPLTYLNTKGDEKRPAPNIPAPNQVHSIRGSISFLQALQYLFKAASSHSQKGASSRSESSGDGSRRRRGVGGGVGSIHCFEPPKLLSKLGPFILEDTGTITTVLVLRDDSLAYPSRGAAKPSLLVDDAAGEGFCDPLEYGHLGDSITFLSGFGHCADCPM